MNILAIKRTISELQKDIRKHQQVIENCNAINTTINEDKVTNINVNFVGNSGNHYNVSFDSEIFEFAMQNLKLWEKENIKDFNNMIIDLQKKL